MKRARRGAAEAVPDSEPEAYEQDSEEEDQEEGREQEEHEEDGTVAAVLATLPPKITVDITCLSVWVKTPYLITLPRTSQPSKISLRVSLATVIVDLQQSPKYCEDEDAIFNDYQLGTNLGKHIANLQYDLLELAVEDLSSGVDGRQQKVMIRSIGYIVKAVQGQCQTL